MDRLFTTRGQGDKPPGLAETLARFQPPLHPLPFPSPPPTESSDDNTAALGHLACRAVWSFSLSRPRSLPSAACWVNSTRCHTESTILSLSFRLNAESCNQGSRLPNSNNRNMALWQQLGPVHAGCDFFASHGCCYSSPAACHNLLCQLCPTQMPCIRELKAL